MPQRRSIQNMRNPRVSSALLFGRCLAAVREDLGLTQAQVATRLNVSRAALGQIESGRSAPSFWVLMRLGQHVGEERVDRDATAIIALFHAAARELREQGVRTVNRMVDDDEPQISVAQIDRAVARVYDMQFSQFVPVRVVYFDDDDDEE